MSLTFHEKWLLVVGMLFYIALKILGYFSPLNFDYIATVFNAA